MTDKDITDLIWTKHRFYCDVGDHNAILYVWDGGKWCNGTANNVILNELSDVFDEEESRRKMSLERTTNFIKGKAMDVVVVKKSPTCISFNNGMLDLNTNELKEHDPSIFCVNQVPWDYNPDARCPSWMAWLGEVTRAEDMEFIQEWTGYNFFTAYPEPAFAVLVGTGQNGKSIYMVTLIKMLGWKNVTNITLADLTYNNFSLAELYHKLADISDEIGPTVIVNAAKLKEASSGSMVNAQRKFGHPFDFRPYAKITYACNEPPEIKDTSDALKFRLKAIEFPYTFTKDPQGDEKLAKDRKELEAKFEEEMPGIINWALEGLRRLSKNNFTFTTNRSTDDTWKFYQRKSNPVVCFIEECLEFTDNDIDWMSKEEMFKAFQKWLENTKIKRKISRDKFFRGMKAEGVDAERSRAHDMKRVYMGIKCSSVPTMTSYYTTTEEEEEEESNRNVGTLERYIPRSDSS